MLKICIFFFSFIVIYYFCSTRNENVSHYVRQSDLSTSRKRENLFDSNSSSFDDGNIAPVNVEGKERKNE